MEWGAGEWKRARAGGRRWNKKRNRELAADPKLENSCTICVHDAKLAKYEKWLNSKLGNTGAFIWYAHVELWNKI